MTKLWVKLFGILKDAQETYERKTGAQPAR